MLSQPRPTSSGALNFATTPTLEESRIATGPTISFRATGALSQMTLAAAPLMPQNEWLEPGSQGDHGVDERIDVSDRGPRVDEAGSQRKLPVHNRRAHDKACLAGQPP